MTSNVPKLTRQQADIILAMLQVKPLSLLEAVATIEQYTEKHDRDLTHDELIEKYSYKCPDGYDTVLGWLSKNHPECFDFCEDVSVMKREESTAVFDWLQKTYRDTAQDHYTVCRGRDGTVEYQFPITVLETVVGMRCL